MGFLKDLIRSPKDLIGFLKDLIRFLRVLVGFLTDLKDLMVFLRIC